MNLTKIEEQFLAEKKARQDALHTEIANIRLQIEPLEEELNSLQAKRDNILDEMRVVAQKRRIISEEHDLSAKCTELAEVARDVTKLLKKMRR